MRTDQRLLRIGNRTTLRKLLVVSVLMFGFGWALVPLYQKICEVTGINVLTSRNPDAENAARNTQVDRTRTVIIEFDANKQGAWRFKPHQKLRRSASGRAGAGSIRSRQSRTTAQWRARRSRAMRRCRRLSICKSSSAFAFSSRCWLRARRASFRCCSSSIRSCRADVKTITLSYTFFEVAGAVAAVQ